MFFTKLHKSYNNFLALTQKALIVYHSNHANKSLGRLFTKVKIYHSSYCDLYKLYYMYRQRLLL